MSLTFTIQNWNSQHSSRVHQLLSTSFNLPCGWVYDSTQLLSVKILSVQTLSSYGKAKPHKGSAGIQKIPLGFQSCNRDTWLSVWGFMYRHTCLGHCVRCLDNSTERQQVTLMLSQTSDNQWVNRMTPMGDYNRSLSWWKFLLFFFCFDFVTHITEKYRFKISICFTFILSRNTSNLQKCSDISNI